MAQMGAAIGAVHFGALHPQHAVDLGADGILGHGLEKARPAGAGIDIWFPTRTAACRSRCSRRCQLALLSARRPVKARSVASWRVTSKAMRLGALVPQQGLPLGVGLLDLVGHAVFSGGGVRTSN